MNAGPRWTLRTASRAVLSTALALAVLCLGHVSPSWAYESAQQERRARIGMRLFRTVLAADTLLEERRDDRGQLQVLVVYARDSKQAAAIAEGLSREGRGPSRGRVRSWLMATRAIAADKFEQQEIGPVAGIFLAEPLNDASFEQLLGFAEQREVMLFSPFAGDVERGASAGLSIGARVLPYLNRDSVRRNRLRLNDMLLRVAKSYER